MAQEQNDRREYPDEESTKKEQAKPMEKVSLSYSPRSTDIDTLFGYVGTITGLFAGIWWSLDDCHIYALWASWVTALFWTGAVAIWLYERAWLNAWIVYNWRRVTVLTMSLSFVGVALVQWHWQSTVAANHIFPGTGETPPLPIDDDDAEALGILDGPCRLTPHERGHAQRDEQVEQLAA